MKKAILLSFALAIFAGTSVQAQDRASKRQNTNQQKRMNDDLNLNNKQASQMKAINMEYQQKANSIRSNTTLSQQQINDQIDALRDETRNKRMAILTATQREKFDDLEKKHGKGYAYGDWKDTDEKRGKRLGADNGGWKKGNGPYKDRKDDGSYNQRGRERFPVNNQDKSKKSKVKK